jgi:hypothetical protein
VTANLAVQATAAAPCSFSGLEHSLLPGSVVAPVPAAVPDLIRYASPSVPSHTGIMGNKRLVSVVVASVVALLMAGCASPPASHGVASGPGIAPRTSTNGITNDRSTWIDWPPPSPVRRVF